MNTQDYLGSVVVILVVMAAAALLEMAFPLLAASRARPGRRRTNLAMTAQTLGFNFLLSSAVAITSLAPPGAPMELAGLPLPLQFAAGFVALDFAFGYFAHRTMHALPLLWRFHRVHHSDEFVDVTTTYRTHPVESAWRYLCLLVAIAALGVPAAVVLVYRVLSAVNGIFEHANLRVPPALDAAVSSAWVTPNMHKVHHSRVPMETDTNYGNLLSLHDRALGTFTPSERGLSVDYGLDDVEPAAIASMTALLAMPFAATSGKHAAGGGATATRALR